MTTKTIVRRLPLLLLLLACSLLLSCQAGPSPADVAADRDRWTAVRDVTADGVVDANTEGPLLADLLLQWDRKLAADEAAAGNARTTQTILADLLRVYGGAAVTVFAAPELQARAPELFRFVDKDSNGTLSESELLSIDPLNPVFALVVASTAQRLLERHR